jgi:hypothetical protein
VVGIGGKMVVFNLCEKDRCYLPNYFFVGCFGDKDGFATRAINGEISETDTSYFDIMSFFEVFFVDTGAGDMFGFHDLLLTV